MTNKTNNTIPTFSLPRTPAQKRGAGPAIEELGSPPKFRRIESGKSSPFSSPPRPLAQKSDPTPPESLLQSPPPSKIKSASSSLLTSPATRLAGQMSLAYLSTPPSNRLVRKALALPKFENAPSFLTPPPAAQKAQSLIEENMNVDSEEIRIVDDSLEQAKIIHENFTRYAPTSNVAKLDRFLANITEETFPNYRPFIQEVFDHIEQPTDLKKLSEIAKRFSNPEKKHFSTIIFDLLQAKETAVCLSLLYGLMKKMDPKFELSETARQIITHPASTEWPHLLFAKPNQIVGYILDRFELDYMKAKDSLDQKKIMDSMIRDLLNPILTNMVQKLGIDSLTECFETIQSHILYLPEAENLCLEEREPLLKMAIRALKIGAEERFEPFFQLQMNKFRSIFVLNHSHITHPELNGRTPQGLHLWHSSKDPTSFEFESEGLSGVATRRTPMIGAGPITLAPYTVDVYTSGARPKSVHGNKISSFFPPSMDLKDLARGLSAIILNPLNDVIACTKDFTEQYFGPFKDPEGNLIHAMIYVRTNGREDGTKVDPDGVRQITSAFPVITRSREGNPFPLRLSKSVKSQDGTQHKLVNGSPLRVNQNTPTKPLKEKISQLVSPVRENRKFRDNLQAKLDRFFADPENPYKLFPSRDPKTCIISAPLKICTGKSLQESMIRAIPLVKDGRAVMKRQEVEEAFESIRSDDVDAFWVIDREELYRLFEEVVPKK